MKVYISADLEGISGIAVDDQLGGENDNYQRAKSLMTEEVNAAVEGAFKGGANQVVVNDSHGSMTNIIIEELHEDALLINGNPKDLSMMSGISEDFQVALLLGYHARKGTKGTLSHTYSGSTIREIKINDVPVGETGINALMAGYFGVPVGLVTGDDMVCSEAEAFLQDVKTAVVKWNISQTAAKNLSPTRARDLIRKRARETVQEYKSFQPAYTQSPVNLEVTFQDRGMAEAASELPDANLVGECVVTYCHEDLLEALKGSRIMITLASASKLS